MIMVGSVIPMEAEKYYDYRLLGDIYNGIPVKIHRQCKFFDIDEVVEYKDGKQVIKSGYPFTEADQKYDSRGRLVSRKFHPSGSVEYEWYDSNFPKKSIHRTGNQVSTVTPQWYANYVKAEIYDGTGTHAYTYEDFDSYGNWTVRKERQGSKQYETTRHITYTTPKADNFLTVVDKNGGIPGAVVEVCDGSGNPVPFIKKYVTDINGKVKNLPWRVNTKYRITFAGYKPALVDGNNPNQRVFMIEQ